jgi:hypothetical protein
MNTQPTNAATAANDDALLSSLLGDVNDEIVEHAHTDDLEAAVADLKSEEVQAVYAAQDAEALAAVADEADVPATDPEAITAEKPKKAKKAAAPKEPKAPRVTSITHKPGDRLVALLGSKDWLQFYKSDSDEANATRAESFIEAMNTRDAIADKVKDKAIMLFTWIASGKDQSGLNEVMLRTFQVLKADGELTSGKNGNLQTNLLGKPYSPGTAASQANQMFMLLPLLGITQREKGKMVVNPDSALLEVVNAKLGL